MNHPKVLDAIKKHAAGYGLTIRSKRSSPFMWFLFVVSLMWIWNRRFMSGFWTTIAGRCWAPMPISSDDWDVVAHEGKHAQQSRKIGEPWFSIAYLFPQCLGVLTLPLAFLLPLPWYACLAIGALPLGPWPAYWRAKFEAEAYAVSLLCNTLLVSPGNPIAYLGDERHVTNHAAHFGQAYYMPIWGNQRRRARARQIVENVRKVFTTGSEDPYLSDVKRIVEENR